MDCVTFLFCGTNLHASHPESDTAGAGQDTFAFGLLSPSCPLRSPPAERSCLCDVAPCPPHPQLANILTASFTHLPLKHTFAHTFHSVHLTHIRTCWDLNLDLRSTQEPDLRCYDESAEIIKQSSNSLSLRTVGTINKIYLIQNIFYILCVQCANHLTIIL